MFRELIRKNKKIPMEECIRLLENQKRGILSVNGDDGYPYGMPMNHWYDPKDGKIYFHCGYGGHREDALKQSDKVSFCVHDEGSCSEGSWALHIKSVIVFGRIQLVDDPALIVKIATKLGHKFTEDEGYIQTEIERYAHRTRLLVLTPEHICGKWVEES